MNERRSRTAAVLAVVALASTPPALADEGSITRADVALALVRFERALDAARPTGEQLAQLNRSFDRATLAFFAGDRQGTLRQLDRLTLALLGLEDDATARAAIRLRVRLEPPRSAAGQACRARVTPLYPVDGAGRAARVALVSERPGRPPVELDPTSASEHELAADVTTDGARGTCERFSLQLAKGQRLEAGRRHDLRVEPAAAAADLRARLQALGDDGDATLRAARACFTSRLGLLTPTPDEEDTAQVFLDAGRHLEELEREASALAAGKDPYRGRPGEQWRAFGAGEVVVPYRVLAPEASLATGRPLPLLIAFHGFQGDENMFRWAYGGGRLFELAEAEGWLLCTPRTEPFMRSPAVFDRLLEELADDYPVDRRRVFVLGHSMGSQAVTLLAARRAETLAGAVLFAGSSTGDKLPTLSIRGALDPMGGFGRRAQANGRVLEGWGHTLIVGPHLPDAFEFLRGVPPRRVYY